MSYLDDSGVSAMWKKVKEHVSAKVGNYLPLSGGTMTGKLSLSGDPTEDKQAVTKSYLDNSNAKLEQAIQNISQNSATLSSVYPVGSIYISTNSTSPASLFGGTWEQIQDKFLLSAGSSYIAGNEIGSDTHTHKYGVSYIAGTLYHYGSDEYTYLGRSYDDYSIIQLGAYDGQKSNAVFPSKKKTRVSSVYVYPNRDYENSNDLAEKVSTTGYRYDVTTDTTSESSLPPSLVVYMWKRTA